MSHPDPLYDYGDEDSMIFENDDDSMIDAEIDTDENEDWGDFYDDSMDGDHDSSMESAGWGTDEDYGYYGGEDY